METFNFEENLKRIITAEYHKGAQDQQAIIKVLDEFFKTSITREEIKLDDGNGVNLLYGLNTQLTNVKGAVLLSGHMDTVLPAVGQKPFYIDDDGTAHGRGVTDMLGFFVSLAAVVEELKSLSIPIIIGITCDEEVEAKGASKLVEYCKRHQIDVDLCIVGEPTDGLVYTSHPSHYKMDVTFTGIAEHTSRLFEKNGTSANEGLVIFWSSLRDGIKPGIVKNMGTITGGSDYNTVAAKTVLQMAFRARYNADERHIKDVIKMSIKDAYESVLGLTIEVEENSMKPAMEKPDYIDLTAFEKNGLEDMKEALFWTEGAFYREVAKNTVVFGPGCIDRGGAHRIDESIGINELKSFSSSLKNVLTTYDKLKR